MIAIQNKVQLAAWYLEASKRWRRYGMACAHKPNGSVVALPNHDARHVHEKFADDYMAKSRKLLKEHREGIERNEEEEK